nr:helix-turn-helix transcriptional regulator [Aurantiacibacter rhizosphaerae]
MPDGRSRKLTAKQRAVLDLLIQHKTSKEIARLLGISHYTVDQRVAAARKKLGVTSRNELAVTYRRISEKPENLSSEAAYRFPHVELDLDDRDQVIGTSGLLNHTAKGPISIKSKAHQPSERHIRVVPEFFEGQYGVYIRLTAIGIVAVLLLTIVLGGLAAFGQLSDLMFS